MEEADGAERGLRWCARAGLAQGGRKGPEEDMKDSAGGTRPVVEVWPQTLGNGEHELAHREVGNDVVYQVGGRLRHALSPTRGTGASGPARERHQELIATTRAASPGEPVGQEAALQIAPELLFHVIRQAVTYWIGLVGQGEVGLQVLPDDAVERSSLGAAPAIGLCVEVGRWSGWVCGPPGVPVSRVGLNRHQQPPTSSGARRLVSTSRTADDWGGGMGRGVRALRLCS